MNFRQTSAKKTNHDEIKCSNCIREKHCKTARSLDRMFSSYKDMNGVHPKIDATKLMQELASKCKMFFYKIQKLK